MARRRILIVEDDAAIRRGVADALEFEGYATLEAADGLKGQEMAVKCACDLLLLDLVLPGRDGLDILREVRLDGGGRAELSAREAELLRYLAANRGRVIARDEILARVWRMNPTGVETRTIDMHVARLREKLRDDPADPKVIITVRGKGYLFAEPETPQ